MENELLLGSEISTKGAPSSCSFPFGEAIPPPSELNSTSDCFSKPKWENPNAEQKGNGKDTTENGDQKKGKEAAEPPVPPKDYIHVRARRGQATDSHSLAERVRRETISERMKFLQDLVPGCNKVIGKAAVLDEIINYVQSLQSQVEFLSMKSATVNPRMDFNMEAPLSKDILQLAPTMVPVDPSTQVFPYGFPSQQIPTLPAGLHNCTETPFSVNPLDAGLSPPTLRVGTAPSLPALPIKQEEADLAPTSLQGRVDSPQQTLQEGASSAPLKILDGAGSASPAPLPRQEATASNPTSFQGRVGSSPPTSQEAVSPLSNLQYGETSASPAPRTRQKRAASTLSRLAVHRYNCDWMSRAMILLSVLLLALSISNGMRNMMGFLATYRPHHVEPDLELFRAVLELKGGQGAGFLYFACRRDKVSKGQQDFIKAVFGKDGSYARARVNARLLKQPWLLELTKVHNFVAGEVPSQGSAETSQGPAPPRPSGSGEDKTLFTSPSRRVGSFLRKVVSPSDLPLMEGHTLDDLSMSLLQEFALAQLAGHKIAMLEAANSQLRAQLVEKNKELAKKDNVQDKESEVSRQHLVSSSNALLEVTKLDRALKDQQDSSQRLVDKNRDAVKALEGAEEMITGIRRSLEQEKVAHRAQVKILESSEARLKKENEDLLKKIKATEAELDAVSADFEASLKDVMTSTFQGVTRQMVHSLPITTKKQVAAIASFFMKKKEKLAPEVTLIPTAAPSLSDLAQPVPTGDVPAKEFSPTSNADIAKGPELETPKGV